MPKKKVNKARQVAKVVKKVVSKSTAPKWYVLSSFAVSIVLLFIYFVDYLSVNAVLSTLIGFALLIWFLINLVMLLIFIKRRVEYKSLLSSIVFFIYFGLMFANSLILGSTSGESGLFGEAFSNNLEIVSIVIVIVLSLASFYHKDYY